MSRALDFFRKTAAQNSGVQRSGATQAAEKNNLIRAPERLKSSPSSPSYPEPNGALAPDGPDETSRLAPPPSQPASAAAGNSGNSGNFLAGPAREKRNFCETDAAALSGSGHKDAIDALRQLKHAGATVTWDGRESRVSFDAVSEADQASLECYRKAAVKVDAYLAAELPEFTPAEQAQAHRLAR